jgi:ribose transport system permease protein
MTTSSHQAPPPAQGTGPEVTAGATEPGDSEAVRSERAVRLGLRVVRLGPLLILLLLGAVIGSVEPLFLNAKNLENVAVQSSAVAILALGQLMVVVIRGVDLSVGSVLGLSTVVGALAASGGSTNGLAVGLVMLGVGATAGLINGVILVKGRIPHPFIITLGMLNAALGLALVLSDGQPISGMPTLIQDIGAGELAGIPVPVIAVCVLAALTGVFMNYTQWGRWIFAVGGNPEAASRSGIPVNRVVVSVYVLCGAAAGAAAMVVAGRADSGFARSGELSELDSIAAVIIGGASFFGGRGSVVGAVVGALIIGVIRNGLNLIGVDADYQLIVIGAVVVAAVGLDVYRSHLEERFRTVQARAEGLA